MHACMHVYVCACVYLYMAIYIELCKNLTKVICEAMKQATNAQA